MISHRGGGREKDACTFAADILVQHANTPGNEQRWQTGESYPSLMGQTVLGTVLVGASPPPPPVPPAPLITPGPLLHLALFQSP